MPSRGQDLGPLRRLLPALSTHLPAAVAGVLIFEARCRWVFQVDLGNAVLTQGKAVACTWPSADFDAVILIDPSKNDHCNLSGGALVYRAIGLRDEMLVMIRGIKYNRPTQNPCVLTKKGIRAN